MNLLIKNCFLFACFFSVATQNYLSLPTQYKEKLIHSYYFPLSNFLNTGRGTKEAVGVPGFWSGNYTIYSLLN